MLFFDSDTKKLSTGIYEDTDGEYGIQSISGWF